MENTKTSEELFPWFDRHIEFEKDGSKYRLIAAMDFTAYGGEKIAKGTRGGWIDDKSRIDDCIVNEFGSWIAEDAVVEESEIYASTIRKNAHVYGNSTVKWSVIDDNVGIKSSDILGSKLWRTKVHDSNLDHVICDGSSSGLGDVLIYDSRLRRMEILGKSYLKHVDADSIQVIDETIAFASIGQMFDSLDYRRPIECPEKFTTVIRPNNWLRIGEYVYTESDRRWHFRGDVFDSSPSESMYRDMVQMWRKANGFVQEEA